MKMVYATILMAMMWFGAYTVCSIIPFESGGEGYCMLPAPQNSLPIAPEVGNYTTAGALNLREINLQSGEGSFPKQFSALTFFYRSVAGTLNMGSTANTISRRVFDIDLPLGVVFAMNWIARIIFFLGMGQIISRFLIDRGE